MKFKINVEGKTYEVEAEERGGRLEMNIDGRPVDVSIEEVSEQKAAVAPAGTAAPAATAKPAAPARTHAGPGKPVICPMAGVVLAVKVKPGDRVSRGDSLFVLEAMKMENDILAEIDGVIGVVKVTDGSRAMQGDVLCTIV